MSEAAGPAPLVPPTRADTARRLGGAGLALGCLAATLALAVRPTTGRIVLAAGVWWATSLMALWSSYRHGTAAPATESRRPRGERSWWREVLLRPHTPRDLQRTSFLAFLACTGFLCAVVLALVTR